MNFFNVSDESYNKNDTSIAFQFYQYHLILSRMVPIKFQTALMPGPLPSRDPCLILPPLYTNSGTYWGG